MLYVAPDGQVLEDGLGGNHAPYAVNRNGERVPLPPKMASILAARYQEPASRAPAYPQPQPPPFSAEHVAAMRSMFPIGDMIAKITSAAGIQPCEPCKRRQEMLNAIGDRFARRFW